MLQDPINIENILPQSGFSFWGKFKLFLYFYVNNTDMSFITVDLSDIKKFEKDLLIFADRAFPQATGSALNSAAFKTQNIAKSKVSREMILRNTFSRSSIQVDKTVGFNVNTQQAIVGSIAKYMETQEIGGTKTAKGKHGVPIATSYSSGEGANKVPRRRLPRKVNKLENIRLFRAKNKGRSRKQRNAMTVHQAAKSNQRFVFLDLRKRKGIFRVLGKGDNLRVRMVADLSSKSIRIPINPWLRPSFREVIPMVPAMYLKALRFQVKKNNLFTD